MKSRRNSDELPNPLPRPLSDPLRMYRRLLAFLVLPGLWVHIIVQWLLPKVDETTPAQLAEHAATAALFILLLCTRAILPNRATSAIYLRSFRNDATTGRLRTVAQQSLGSGFRLSGIRDPRRRWPWLIRHIFYILFLIRYAQPKFMNLEAGDDWKSRLWRSLGEARCAVIDVSDLTPFVADEIRLAVQCLGFHRILFVGNDSQPAEEWRKAVLAALDYPDVFGEKVQVAVWGESGAGQAAFRGKVRLFAESLPDEPAELNPQALVLMPRDLNESRKNLHAESWWAFILANVLGTGGAILLGGIEVVTKPTLLLAYLPVIAYDSLAALLLLQYFAVCGSWRQRISLCLTATVGLVVGGLPVFADAFSNSDGVRGAARRMKSSNNLKQIGIGIHSYHASNERFPPQAVCRPDGTPLLSWRVLMLPYLEEEQLFQEFKLDEPWDGPHNSKLLSRIPRIYQSPYVKPGDDLTRTPFQLIVGPGTMWGEPRPPGRAPRMFFAHWPATTPVAAFDPPYTLGTLPRGSTNTLLAVEAANTVPWTKPEDVEFLPAASRSKSDEMLQRLGASKRGRFPIVLADGSTHTMSRGAPPTELDDLILVDPQ